jgi:hypothetical protein
LNFTAGQSDCHEPYHHRFSAVNDGEHAIEWGAHAAQDPSTGLKPACQDRNACSSVSFSTATRTVKNGWTVSRFHRICWDLIIRFAMIWFTADSAKAVEIGAPAR